MTVDLRPEEAFRRSMIDRNLGPAGMIAIVSDGQIHRYRVEGDKAGSRNGWYVLFADGVPAGKFGSWKTGETHTWCLKAHEELTEAEKLARAEQQKAAQQAREAEQHVWEETAAKVAAHWQNGREVSSDHSYVVAKGVTPKGARQLGEQLMIPFYDADGRLRTLQWIQPDGSKRYAGGGQKLGTYCAIGHVDMV